MLVEARGLSKAYRRGRGFFGRDDDPVHAVHQVDLTIRRGENLALVGESGSGKTTVGKLLARLIRPTAGSILFYADEGPIDLARLSGSELKGYRRRVQVIFQDPYTSLNPRLTILRTVSEPLEVQGIGTDQEREATVSALLETVGLAPASSFLDRLPGELSGGQRQRVGIARALVIEPDFLIADEPTSMLDAIVRRELLDLLRETARKMGVTYLLITHDMGAAGYLCERIAVMYQGKIVEVGDRETVLRNPRHAHTRALLSAVPRPYLEGSGRC